VPRNTPPNTTVIASLTLRGIGPSVLMPGATDGLAFEAYLERVLAPALRPGQVVILDNLSVHRSARVEHLIRARGCELWFLPSYSPDFSLIEQAFAKFKQALRRAGARTLEVLYEAIGQALPTISPYAIICTAQPGGSSAPGDSHQCHAERASSRRWFPNFQNPLDTEGKVPGIDETAFRAAAEKAKEICPVSGLLKPGLEALTLNAKLVS
jgi:transposase